MFGVKLANLPPGYFEVLQQTKLTNRQRRKKLIRSRWKALILINNWAKEWRDRAFAAEKQFLKRIQGRKCFAGETE